MLPPESLNQIRARLDELKRLESCLPFAQLYYELITARLADQTLEGLALQRAFATYLARELRYHLQLRNLQNRDDVELGDVISLADKRGVGLQDTLDVLDAIATTGDAQEATRRLMVAECWLHLQRFDHAVAQLEAAVALGADEPLAHFALGFNRYLLARGEFTVPDEESGNRLVVELDEFRSALLRAVSSFEQGLTGGPLDPYLYSWIGTCLREAGFEAAAEDAFTHSQEVAQDADMGRRGLIAAEETILKGPQALPSISAEEVRQVGELLKRSYSVADVLGDERG